MNHLTAKLLMLAACSTVSAHASALDIPDISYPPIVEYAVSPEAFVPEGWRLEHVARGHLNDDAHEDALLVLRMDSPDNVVANDLVFGPTRFNSNPRMLVAALGEADGGWRQVMVDHTLVPRPDSPVMDDYLEHDPAQAVGIRANRTWSIRLNSWASVGTWSTRNVTYTFRFEGDCMRLIGFDDTHMHRASGETTTRSVNYLNGRAWWQHGSIQTDRPEPQQWTRLSSQQQLCIDDIGDGLAFEPKLLDGTPSRR